MRKFTLLMASVALALLIAAPAFAGTLDDIKARGHLKCGVAQQLIGFAFADNQGNFAGLDVDFCRGLAAAIGVDVQFTALTAKERFPALQTGEVDLLYRNTTWTMSRDTELGFDFVGVNFYDGQGFMVRKSSGVKSAKELDGATVCVNTGTTTELNLADYFRSNGMSYKPVLYEKAEDVRLAYEAGRCDVHTTDKSGLAAQRAAMKDPTEHYILPETISKEPLGPAVRHGDNAWGDTVRWVFNASLVAEEKGVTQGNVQTMAATSKDPEIQRMLGATGTHGASIGLDKDWAVKAIKAVGNYGEIFDRNVGPNTPVKLNRDQNDLWTRGGLQYAPPVR